jgi:hypothetical protein
MGWLPKLTRVSYARKEPHKHHFGCRALQPHPETRTCVAALPCRASLVAPLLCLPCGVALLSCATLHCTIALQHLIPEDLNMEEGGD